MYTYNVLYRVVFGGVVMSDNRKTPVLYILVSFCSYYVVVLRWLYGASDFILDIITAVVSLVT